MAILKFLGNGSCFNTKSGNTSAYTKVFEFPDDTTITEDIYLKSKQSGDVNFIDSCNFHHNCKESEMKKRLILFDCGESVFERIIEKGILDDVDEVTVLITHLHSDHAGSLPSLIFYLHYVKNICPRIIFYSNRLMVNYLDICGVGRELYTHYPKLTGGKLYYTMPLEVIFQEHANLEHAYGYVLNIAGYTVYYSGDTTFINQNVLELFRENQKWFHKSYGINEFYQDVTKYENDAHMNILKLAEIIKPEERSRITCMHFDDDETIEIARNYGFNIAEVT